MATHVTFVESANFFFDFGDFVKGAHDGKVRRKSATRDQFQDGDIKGRNGAPEEIRTPDPQIRSLVLYPAELRVRAVPVVSGGVAIL